MKEVNGNLINALKTGEVNVIAHQANCWCKMKSGIAKSITDEWSSVRVADDSTIKGDVNKLGTFTKAAVPFGVVYNLYGQFGYGRDKIYTDYKAVEESLKNLVNDLYKPTKIGLPKLGCGLAGGDWEVVKEIIKGVFNETDHEVTIYSM